MDNKEKIVKELHIKDVFESNIFLRKLWSLFDEYLIKKEGNGNGWQYMPTELNDNLIMVGNCNIATVYVKLEKEGGLKAIILETKRKNKNDIENCLNDALNANIKESDYCCIYYCCSYANTPVANASFGKAVIICSQEEQQIKICINIKAFSYKDASHVAANMLPHLASLLFVYFHNNVYVSKTKIVKTEIKSEPFYQGETEQQEWFDSDETPKNINGEYVIQNQFLRALNELESIVWNRKNVVFPIINSARNVKLANDELRVLYKRGLEQYSDYTLLDGYINGMIMSALEGLATRNTVITRCETCGQPVYSISKSVKEYVKKNMNESMSIRASYLYKKRSQLFHKNRINFYEYAGTSWPLLMTLKEDKDDEIIKYKGMTIKNKFIGYFGIGESSNFIDYVIYLIRKELNDIFKKDKK